MSAFATFIGDVFAHPSHFPPQWGEPLVTAGVSAAIADGIGPVVALTYRATVDVPARFRKSKSVGAAFGLTSAKYQSGEINRSGAISKCGDDMCE